MKISELQKESHTIAKEKGWWDEPRAMGDVIANIHDEVSEAWREYTHNNDLRYFYYMRNTKPNGFPIELADVIIRVLDLAGHLEIDMEKAIEAKMDYNKTRSYRHGGKKA